MSARALRAIVEAPEWSEFEAVRARYQQGRIMLGEAYDPFNSEPQFKPADEPDKYRDLYNDNMPRVSGCMYFAIPGEQPLHVNDEQARHILAYLSETENDS